MGEKAKKSGEFGEAVVKELLMLIGWNNPIENVDINCFKPKYHRISESDRKTHGIDFIYNYESQLVNNRQESNVISSKYEEKYSSFPSTFKSHLKDIAFAIQCFPIVITTKLMFLQISKQRILMELYFGYPETKWKQIKMYIKK